MGECCPWQRLPLECAVDSGTPAVLTDAINELSLPPESRILIATSGGSDSVALALAFHTLSLQPGNRWELRLAHVNHSLRGAESDEDEVFVRALARRLKLEVDVVRVNTAAYAAHHHLSIETAARQLRYEELRRALRAWGGDVIAVGHHSDDQAETVLMNLIRGGGLDGLSGMSVRAGGIIRPFLRIPKQTITAALDSMGEPYRVDSSNADVGARRNLLRHRVMPLLEEISPAVRGTVTRTASQLSDDAEYLITEASSAMRYMDARLELKHISAATGVFRTLHPAVQGRVLRLMVDALKGNVNDLSAEHVRLMRQAISETRPRSQLLSQLPHRLQLEVTKDRFHLFQEESEPSSIPEPACLPIPGTVEIAVGHLEASIIPPATHEDLPYWLGVCGPDHAFCDADVLGNCLLVRSRQPGDRMSPLHSPGTKKLQDLFVDAKIPGRKRDRIPILATDEFVVWVPGFGVDRRASVGPETKRVAHLQFRAFL
jgi:tRNA(Ile)-lysidine synthase